MSTADLLKAGVAKYYHKKRKVVLFELGLNKQGRLRADVVALGMKGDVTVVEVKSSVADFKSDKKFIKYYDYCNKLYLAMEHEVYVKVKDLIPSGVGVFLFNSHDLIKVLPAKSQTLPSQVAQNLAIRACFRCAGSKKRKNSYYVSS